MTESPTSTSKTTEDSKSDTAHSADASTVTARSEVSLLSFWSLKTYTLTLDPIAETSHESNNIISIFRTKVISILGPEIYPLLVRLESLDEAQLFFSAYHDKIEALHLKHNLDERTNISISMQFTEGIEVFILLHFLKKCCEEFALDLMFEYTKEEDLFNHIIGHGSKE
jgi:hypothetical protein